MRKIPSLCRLLLGFGLGFAAFMVLHTHSPTAYSPEHRHVIGMSVGDTQMTQLDDSIRHIDNRTVADQLAKKVRVLCWVMTSPSNHRKRADAVKSTWGRRCNILLFFSSADDRNLHTITLNVTEGRTHLTAKTMLAFDYVHEHYLHQADWFIKCDDDTYVIVENLRYFLSSKDTNEAIYFGHHFHTLVKQGYYSGGAGYVLSKEALVRFAKRDRQFCRDDGGAEDVEIGKCFEGLGIRTGNSSDSNGRSRFHCFNAETHLSGNYPAWYTEWMAGGVTQRISDQAISFHYITARQMMALDFFVYHLRPYGIVSRDQNIG